MSLSIERQVEHAARSPIFVECGGQQLGNENAADGDGGDRVGRGVSIVGEAQLDRGEGVDGDSFMQELIG